MKSTQLVIVASIVIAGFSACNDSASEAKVKADNFVSYVDSVEKLPPVYTAASWTSIQNGYQEKELKEETKAELEAGDKTKVEENEAKYAALKTTYDAKIKEKEYKQKIRNSLFGDGKINEDLKFDFVTADNMLSVYESFVNAVEKNKDNYSKEDWDEIKALFEALNARKNEVEKDISTGDNLKIGGLKIKFGAIKAMNRPFAKEEN